MLLIEDDEGDALLVQEELAEVHQPPQIEWVRSLAGALEPLRRGAGCVLLDLGLPDASALDGLRWVREQAPEAAVLVLTGHDDEHLGIEALGAGAQDYLLKGHVDGNLLARSIRYAIERRRAERAALELHEATLQARENARLERGLLPTPLISDQFVRVITGYRPARGGAILGGDFFDAIELSDQRIQAVIGDVSGHSADEAALGACLRIAWRTMTLAGSDMLGLLGTLEQMLEHERHDRDIFATLCVVSIAPDHRELEIRMAGHPWPILIDRSGARQLTGATRPPLGVSPAQEWPLTRVRPEGEWSLLLYTDGLIEGQIGEGPERLGSERLVELINEIGPGEPMRLDQLKDTESIVSRLIDRVRALSHNDLSDDVAALWLSVNPDGPSSRDPI